MILQKNDFVTFSFEDHLLTITIQDKEPTNEEWQFCKTHILSYYEAHIQKNTTFSIICDMANAKSLPMFRIMDWATFFRKTKKQIKKCIRCTAFVTEDNLVRNSMCLFFKLYSPARPIQFVQTIKDAQQWIQKQHDDL